MGDVGDGASAPDIETEKSEGNQVTNLALTKEEQGIVGVKKPSANMENTKDENLAKSMTSEATTSNAPEPEAAGEEDDRCCVCFSPDSYDDDQMVYCDKCNIAVHQSCYGVKVIPEGDWFCDKCRDGLEDKDVKCRLCSTRGYAFKKDTKGRHVHSACAFWIPECGFRNPEKMEPIEGVDDVDRERWLLMCGVCRRERAGACIQCIYPSCKWAVHPLCGFRAKVRMFLEEIPVIDGGDSVCKGLYCPEHRHIKFNPRKYAREEAERRRRGRRQQQRQHKRKPSGALVGTPTKRTRPGLVSGFKAKEMKKQKRVQPAPKSRPVSSKADDRGVKHKSSQSMISKLKKAKELLKSKVARPEVGKGLIKFGRDWDKLAKYLGIGKLLAKKRARDHLAILWLRRKPLPEKVRESGNTYTLDGTSKIDRGADYVKRVAETLKTKLPTKSYEKDRKTGDDRISSSTSMIRSSSKKGAETKGTKVSKLLKAKNKLGSLLKKKNSSKRKQDLRDTNPKKAKLGDDGKESGTVTNGDTVEDSQQKEDAKQNHDQAPKAAMPSEDEPEEIILQEEGERPLPRKIPKKIPRRSKPSSRKTFRAAQPKPQHPKHNNGKPIQKQLQQQQQQKQQKQQLPKPRPDSSRNASATDVPSSSGGPLNSNYKQVPADAPITEDQKHDVHASLKFMYHENTVSGRYQLLESVLLEPPASGNVYQYSAEEFIKGHGIRMLIDWASESWFTHSDQQRGGRESRFLDVLVACLKALAKLFQSHGNIIDWEGPTLDRARVMASELSSSGYSFIEQLAKELLEFWPQQHERRPAGGSSRGQHRMATKWNVGSELGGYGRGGDSSHRGRRPFGRQGSRGRRGGRMGRLGNLASRSVPEQHALAPPELKLVGSRKKKSVHFAEEYNLEEWKSRDEIDLRFCRRNPDSFGERIPELELSIRNQGDLKSLGSNVQKWREKRRAKKLERRRQKALEAQ
uniref:PHD-type domain-containing protein n=1 Tax=Lotharella globosa TaxID=91324 RepID=A0A7S3YZ57_9EUKA